MNEIISFGNLNIRRFVLHLPMKKIRIFMGKLLLRKYGLTALGTVLGMVAGYLYWRYVGCASGTCPITSSPLMSTIWGGMMGGLLLNMFQPVKKN